MASLINGLLTQTQTGKVTIRGTEVPVKLVPARVVTAIRMLIPDPAPKPVAVSVNKVEADPKHPTNVSAAAEAISLRTAAHAGVAVGIDHDDHILSPSSTPEQARAYAEFVSTHLGVGEIEDINNEVDRIDRGAYLPPATESKDAEGNA